MTVENATYIHQLDQSLPTNVDLISEGDDQIRLLKKTVKNTFPNVAGAVTATHTELSFATGVTSGIQSQIASKATKAGDTYTGTHNFTGASVTVAEPPPGDSSAKPATTAFVQSTAFTSALPLQAGNNGKALFTDGTDAAWQSITQTDVVGLVGALVGKAASVHSHTTSEVAGLDAALDGLRDVAPLEVTAAGAYTLALAARGRSIQPSSAVTGITIPNNATVALPRGFTAILFNSKGANLTITAAGGVTLYPAGLGASAASCTVRTWGSVTIHQTAANTWAVSGDLV